MDKNTEIKFVGKPIFKHILNLVNMINIQGLTQKHQSDLYYKAFKAPTQLITMHLGILSRL
jgi:hypothetical protein